MRPALAASVMAPLPPLLTECAARLPLPRPAASDRRPAQHMHASQTRARLGFRRDKTFVPTPNVRNPQMLKEAEAFCQQLAAFERAAREYHRNVQGARVLRGVCVRAGRVRVRVCAGCARAAGCVRLCRACACVQGVRVRTGRVRACLSALFAMFAVQSRAVHWDVCACAAVVDARSLVAWRVLLLSAVVHVCVGVPSCCLSPSFPGAPQTRHSWPCRV